jgi:(p)ppGpp synthase/HD superfamily hydrolase
VNNWSNLPGDLVASPRIYPSFVSDLPLTRSALDFAAERHRGQRRDTDGAPFILHPLEVAQLLRGRDCPDHVVAAGVLHDVLEDTDVDCAELAERFGEDVAGLVCSVSEPPGGGSYEQRKQRLRDRVSDAPRDDSRLIYAADKVAKVRELRIGLAQSRRDLPAEKLGHYWASLHLLEAQLGGHPLVRQLRFELEALELLPPTTSA